MQGHNDDNEMDLTRLLKQLTTRKMPNWMTFVLHRMRNVSRHFARNESEGWLRLCTGAAKAKKKSSRTCGCGRFLLHTVEQVG